MFAQTGIDSTKPNAVPSTEVASSGIWWLIPLAIGCLGLIWYLRRLNNSTLQTSVEKDSLKRPSTKVKASTTAESENSTDSSRVRQVHTSKSSAKKKKKGQANNQRNTKKPKEKQVDSQVAAKSTSETRVSSYQSSNSVSLVEQAMEAKAPALAQAPSPVPVPVAAIFEPLRSVAPPRRKVSLERQSEEEKPKQISDESVSRSASGGKFERMVPSTAYTRAAANRWPDSMTNTVVRTVAASPSETISAPKPLSNVSTVSISETAHPAAPANGLKSFVSKLKNASASDSDSDSVGKIPEKLTGK